MQELWQQSLRNMEAAQARLTAMKELEEEMEWRVGSESNREVNFLPQGTGYSLRW